MSDMSDFLEEQDLQEGIMDEVRHLDQMFALDPRLADWQRLRSNILLVFDLPFGRGPGHHAAELPLWRAVLEQVRIFRGYTWFQKHPAADEQGMLPAWKRWANEDSSADLQEVRWRLQHEAVKPGAGKPQTPKPKVPQDFDPRGRHHAPGPPKRGSGGGSMNDGWAPGGRNGLRGGRDMTPGAVLGSIQSGAGQGVFGQSGPAGVFAQSGPAGVFGQSALGQSGPARDGGTLAGSSGNVGGTRGGSGAVGTVGLTNPGGGMGGVDRPERDSDGGAGSSQGSSGGIDSTGDAGGSSDSGPSTGGQSSSGSAPTTSAGSGDGSGGAAAPRTWGGDQTPPGTDSQNDSQDSHDDSSAGGKDQTPSAPSGSSGGGGRAGGSGKAAKDASPSSGSGGGDTGGGDSGGDDSGGDQGDHPGGTVPPGMPIAKPNPYDDSASTSGGGLLAALLGLTADPNTTKQPGYGRTDPGPDDGAAAASGGTADVRKRPGYGGDTDPWDDRSIGLPDLTRAPSFGRGDPGPDGDGDVGSAGGLAAQHLPGYGRRAQASVTSALRFRGGLRVGSDVVPGISSATRGAMRALARR